MPVYLYDALYPAGIPLDIEPDAIVASYIDHPEVVPPCMAQLAQRFPDRTRVGISAHGNPAMILDCESGAILPPAIPALVTASRAAGFTVAVYASPANWSLALQACTVAKVTPPLWWAVIRSLGPVIPAGAVGNQYLGAGPYDKSIITDKWAEILTMTTPADTWSYDIVTGPESTQPAYSVLSGLAQQVAAIDKSIAPIQVTLGQILKAVQAGSTATDSLKVGDTVTLAAPPVTP